MNDFENIKIESIKNHLGFGFKNKNNKAHLVLSKLLSIFTTTNVNYKRPGLGFCSIFN